MSGVAGCAGGETKGILYPVTQESMRGICFQASRKFAKRLAGVLTLKFNVSWMMSCCAASDGPFGGNCPIADKCSICAGSMSVDADIGPSASAHLYYKKQLFNYSSHGVLSIIIIPEKK